MIRAVQRERCGSGKAVGIGPSMCSPAEKSWIPPQIGHTENVAGQLACFLGLYSNGMGCYNGRCQDIKKVIVEFTDHACIPKGDLKRMYEQVYPIDCGAASGDFYQFWTMGLDLLCPGFLFYLYRHFSCVH